MGIEVYFVRFFIQEPRLIPTSFLPPHNLTNKMCDGQEVMGLFIQDTTGDAIKASAQKPETRGRFITSIDSPIDNLRLLRRERDGKFFSLSGDPQETPDQAMSQFKIYSAAIIDRPPEHTGDSL